MSGRDDDETPADRIEKVRRSLPPKPGRNSRLGYMSKDDFADLIGAGRTRVIDWTTGKAYPDLEHRRRLAELSGGRYSPDDFRRPGVSAAERASLEHRLGELEAEVATLKQFAEAATVRLADLEGDPGRAGRSRGQEGSASR